MLAPFSAKNIESGGDWFSGTRHHKLSNYVGSNSPMSHPTAVNSGEDQNNEQLPTGEHDPQLLVGSLLDEEQERVPLLYFTSFVKAWVSSSSLLFSFPSQFSCWFCRILEASLYALIDESMRVQNACVYTYGTGTHINSQS